jgi:hypothetical protein
LWDEVENDYLHTEDAAVRDEFQAIARSEDTYVPTPEDLAEMARLWAEWDRELPAPEPDLDL